VREASLVVFNLTVMELLNFAKRLATQKHMTAATQVCPCSFIMNASHSLNQVEPVLLEILIQ
jgi:hypothetical protein